MISLVRILSFSFGFPIMVALLQILACECTKYDDLYLKYLQPNLPPCEDFYAYSCRNYYKYHEVSPRDGSTYYDEFKKSDMGVVKIAQEFLNVNADYADTSDAALQLARTFYHVCMIRNGGPNIKPPEIEVILKTGFPLLMPFKERPHPNGFWNHIGSIIASFGVPLFFDFTIVPYHGADNVVNPPLYMIKIVPEHIPQQLDLRASSMASGYVPKSFMASFQIDHNMVQNFYLPLMKRLRPHLGQYGAHFTTDEHLLIELEAVRLFRQQLHAAMEPVAIDQNVPRLRSQTITVQELDQWTTCNFGGSIKLEWIKLLKHVFGMVDQRLQIENDQIVYLPISVENLYKIMDVLRHTDERVLLNYAVLKVLTFYALDSEPETANLFESLQNIQQKTASTTRRRAEYCAAKVVDVHNAVGVSGLSFTLVKMFRNYLTGDAGSLVFPLILDAVRREVTLALCTRAAWLDVESRQRTCAKFHLLPLTDLMAAILTEDTLQPLRTYALRFHESDHYGNARRLQVFKRTISLQQIFNRRGVNLPIWHLSPLSAHIVYDVVYNHIAIPMTMHSRKRFSTLHRYLSYARFGFLFARALLRTIDTRGRMYDQHGNNIDHNRRLWTEVSELQFQNLAHCFGQNLNRFVDAADPNNQNALLNEHLMDFLALDLSFSAFNRYESALEVAPDRKYTVRQMFFIAWSTMLCSLDTERHIRDLQSQGFPTNHVRVNAALSQLAAFAQEFQCPVNSNLNPVQKCQPWIA